MKPAAPTLGALTLALCACVSTTPSGTSVSPASVVTPMPSVSPAATAGVPVPVPPPASVRPGYPPGMGRPDVLPGRSVAFDVVAAGEATSSNSRREGFTFLATSSDELTSAWAMMGGDTGMPDLARNVDFVTSNAALIYLGANGNLYGEVNPVTVVDDQVGNVTIYYGFTNPVTAPAAMGYPYKVISLPKRVAMASFRKLIPQ